MKIRIRQYTFDLRDRYTPGHCCTAGEAQALNQQLAENIRNNIDRLVVDAVAVLPPGQLLSLEAQQALQARISEYESRYEFQTRHISRRNGPIESTVEEICRARAEQQLRAEGRDEVEDEVVRLMAEFQTLPEVQEEARRLVATREQLAREAADLL